MSNASLDRQLLIFGGEEELRHQMRPSFTATGLDYELHIQEKGWPVILDAEKKGYGRATEVEYVFDCPGCEYEVIGFVLPETAESMLINDRGFGTQTSCGRCSTHFDTFCKSDSFYLEISQLLGGAVPAEEIRFRVVKYDTFLSVEERMIDYLLKNCVNNPAEGWFHQRNGIGVRLPARSIEYAFSCLDCENPIIDRVYPDNNEAHFINDPGNADETYCRFCQTGDRYEVIFDNFWFYLEISQGGRTVPGDKILYKIEAFSWSETRREYSWHERREDDSEWDDNPF